MKFAWHRNITDVAAWNSEQMDEVDLDEYRKIVEAELQAEEFEKDADEIVLDD